MSISKAVQFSENAQKSGHAYDVTDDAHFVMFIKCILSLISSYIPSPSSLMDLGSETAKHCIVSYFCCWGSCSCDSSWFSLCGLTSIRQLNVWLFLLGPSLDQGTPFTTEKKKECRWSLFRAATRYYTTGRQRKCIEEATEDTILQGKDIKRARQRKTETRTSVKSEKVVAG